MDNSKFVKPGLFLSVIAIIMSVIAIILSFTGNTSGETEIASGDKTNRQVVDSLDEVRIAYVNIDTLLLEYKLSIKLNEDLLTQQAKSRANLENQIKAFERDYNSFMEKVKLGSFMSQASMESQQKELIDKQQRLEQLDRELSESLMIKQAEMNEQLYDTIMNFMKSNYQDKYSLILGNAAGAAILYAMPEMDITREVVDALNERYEMRQNKQKD